MKRGSATAQVAARAIDVGYFNTKFTLGQRTGTTIKAGVFPSLAPRLETNRMMDTNPTPVSDGCWVAIAGVHYFVGRAAGLHVSPDEPRVLGEDYCTTDKYLAMARGALHYMAVDEDADELSLDLLVVGLPCNTFARYHERLAQRMRGEHMIGRNGQVDRRIFVGNVQVVPQPQGALVHWGATCNLANSMSLVLDAGGGTFDWFVSRGREALWQRVGAYPKGMLACTSAVIKLIEPEWLNDHSVVERVDAAIRSSAESFKIGQRAFLLANFRKTIDAVLQECVSKMISSAGRLDTMDQIFVTGGGAKVFGEFLRKQYPSIANGVKIDEDPIYSNVRGFQVIGDIMRRQATA